MQFTRGAICSTIRSAPTPSCTRLRLAAKRGVVLLCVVCWSSTFARAFAEERAASVVSGDSVIRAPAGPSEIVITTTSRLAGAIHSLTWGGREFIDSADHGRQLQSAANFDAGKPFFPEVFNPTEAGSSADGQISTSRLLELKIAERELATRTQMAFWLRPGERSEGHLAYNDQVLSNHLLTKRVRIGYKNLPQAIEYVATFTVPAGERHTFAQFEALTG